MLIIVLITVTLMFGGSDAVLCYNCTSADTPDCENAINNTDSIPTCSGTWCSIGKTTNTIPAGYARQCGQTTLVPEVNSCTAVAVGSIQAFTCVCDTGNLCNADFSANSQPPTNVPSGVSRILAWSAAVVLLAKLQR